MKLSLSELLAFFAFIASFFFLSRSKRQLKGESVLPVVKFPVSDVVVVVGDDAEDSITRVEAGVVATGVEAKVVVT